MEWNLLIGFVQVTDNSQLSTNNSYNKYEIINEKKQQAAILSVDRIFTDEDFERIDAALIRKQVESAKRGKKRPHPDDVINKPK